MPLTLQEKPVESGRSAMNCQSASGAALSEGRAASTTRATHMPARVEKLFGPDPVDLTKVCDEIRRTPGLEAVTLRVMGSLSLTDDDSLHTIEEAAIALGTSRLKALFQGWTMLQAKELSGAMLMEPVTASALASDASDSGSAMRCTPESLYLAGFLRILGLDSPFAAASLAGARSVAASGEGESYSGLTEIFIRDFISLIPNLGVAAVASEAAVAGAGRSS